MGATLSQEQREILSTLQGVADIYTEGIPKKELKQLLLWARLNYPLAETCLLFEVGFWQEINRHLYVLATKKDETALKLLSPARIMLQGILLQSKRKEKQQTAAAPAVVEEQSSGKKLALALKSQGERALGKREQKKILKPPIKKCNKPLECPDNQESLEESGAEWGEQEDKGSGGQSGDAAAAANAGSAGEEEETRAEGETRKNPAGGSHTGAGAESADGGLGENVQPQRATVARRRRRAVVTSDPVRRSARIAARAGEPGGGVNTASEEEEAESGTDRGRETSEVERGGEESDVSSGDTESGSESTHAQRVGRGRSRARSPMTSRGPTPSPDPVPLVETLGVPVPSLHGRRFGVQAPFSAELKVKQTRSQIRLPARRAGRGNGAVELTPSSEPGRPVTAPPSGRRAEVHDMPGRFGGATAPSRGETATMQQFFPTIYKKKSTSKKTMLTQQRDYLSTSEFHEDDESSDEEQLQGEDVIRITASEGVPTWMLSAAEAAKSFLHSFNTAKKKYQQDPRVSFSDLGARPKTSRQKMRHHESPMTSTTPLFMQIPVESDEEAFQEPVKTMDWRQIRKALEKEKHLFPGSGDLTMPVTYDAQGQNPRWERMGHETLKDLGKAAQTFGLNSQYFKQLLRGTFTMCDLTPYDIRSIVAMVLTDTQILIWEKRWRKYLAELRNRYQGGPNANFTEGQLAGDPPDDNPGEQAARLPRRVLNDIKEAARLAIIQITPTGAPDVPFSCIRQGPTEPFMSFIDRLTQAVDRQVTTEEVKRPLLENLAFGNANPDCQRVISTMPGRPSLAEMVEACSKVGTPQHVAAIVKNELREEWEKQLKGRSEGQSEDKTLEKMFEKLLHQQDENVNKVLAAMQKKNKPQGGQCYRCGESGHMKRNCPRTHIPTPAQKAERPICARCGRGRHSVKECYSRTDVEGNPLPHPGNGKLSARNPQRAQTQVLAVSQEQTGQSSVSDKQVPSAKPSADSTVTQTSSHQEHSVHWQLQN